MQSFSLPILQSPLGMPHVLTVATALFALGLYGALAHRNFLRILMGLELMLLAAMINLVAFTTYLHPAGLQGQAITLLLAIMALAQLGLGLALAVTLMRRDRPAPRSEADPPQGDPLDVDRLTDLKG